MVFLVVAPATSAFATTYRIIDTIPGSDFIEPDLAPGQVYAFKEVKAIDDGAFLVTLYLRLSPYGENQSPLWNTSGVTFFDPYLSANYAIVDPDPELMVGDDEVSWFASTSGQVSYQLILKPNYVAGEFPTGHSCEALFTPASDNPFYYSEEEVVVSSFDFDPANPYFGTWTAHSNRVKDLKDVSGEGYAPHGHKLVFTRAIVYFTDGSWELIEPASPITICGWKDGKDTSGTILGPGPDEATVTIGGYTFHLVWDGNELVDFGIEPVGGFEPKDARWVAHEELSDGVALLYLDEQGVTVVEAVADKDPSNPNDVIRIGPLGDAFNALPFFSLVVSFALTLLGKKRLR
jgi:hypothetical protein